MKKIFFYSLMCMSMSLISCDKIKDATSKDFKVNNVSFDFTAKAGTSTMSTPVMSLRSEGVTQSFSETRTIDISELGSSEVTEYKNKISQVAMDHSLVKVTADAPGTFIVENLTLMSPAIPGSMVIPSYTLGGTLSLTQAMEAYMILLVMKLVGDKTVTVTVSGLTNAPPGTTLSISYESDMIFTASVF